MKFSVFTLGCKVNRYESGSMMSKLASCGYEVTDAIEYADAYIINTCSVTAEADKKSRQAVSRVLKCNPNALVYVMGCSSQNDAMQFDRPNVRLICGTASKCAMLDNIIAGISPLNLPPSLIADLPEKYETEPAPIGSRTRGLLKVQDGCNNFCSYCIIPHLRGRSRSRPIDSVIEEAAQTAEHTKEIVLTGINLSAYGKDVGLTLTDLVKALKGVDVRKRLGSLECEVIDEGLLSAMKDSGFCDHFHVSMQSGSDAVLKAMNRRYDSKFFLSKVELIRKFFPDAGITTDIICGFPTESEQDHIQSMRTAEKAAFSGAHVFPYSRRDGTPAAKMKQLPAEVKERRAAQMSELCDRTERDFLTVQRGKTYPIYFEETEDGCSVGFTPNYIKAYYDGNRVKQISNLKIGEIYKQGVKVYE